MTATTMRIGTKKNGWHTAKTLIAALCAFSLLAGGVAVAAPGDGKASKAMKKAKGEYLLPKAKAAKQVGEQADGYLGLVDKDAPANIKKMVKDTNARRKAKYTDIANKRGSTVKSVGELAGQKLAKRANPGEMLRTAEGEWVTK